MSKHEPYNDCTNRKLTIEELVVGFTVMTLTIVAYGFLFSWILGLI